MLQSLPASDMPSSSGKKYARLFALGLAVLGSFFLLQIPKTHAATCTFASQGDNLFATGANWSCGGAVPTNGDDIVIPSATSVNAVGATINVKSVSSSGAFNITDSVLMATSTITVNSGGSVTSTSGTISASSTLTIFSGATVTSTSGLLDIGGAVSSTGSIGSSSGNMLFRSTFRNEGTFNLGSGVATTTGTFTSVAGSTFNQNSGRLVVLSGCNTTEATNNVQSGTIRYAGSSAQSVCTPVHNNLEVLKTGGNLDLGILSVLTVGGTLAVNSPTQVLLNTTAGNNNTITGATTIVSGGSVTTTDMNLIFTGPVSSTGSIGASSGNMRFGSTFQNNGTFQLGSGVATTTLTFTSAAGSTFSQNSGRLVVLAGCNTANATNNLQNGTIRYAGASNQSVCRAGHNNLEVLKTGGELNLGINSLITVAGTLAVNSPTLVILDGTPGNNNTITGATTIVSGGSVTTTAMNFIFTGAVSSTGSIGSDSGNILFSSTLQNNGTLDLGGESTTTGALTNTGTIHIALSQILHAPSSITNTGTITLGGGAYISHAVDSVLLTDSSGTEASSYSTPGSIYLTVQDQNRNLLGDTAETIIAGVSVSAGGGSDIEPITLTETGPATGIFRNTTAMPLVSSSVVSLGNGQIELTASALGTGAYSDGQDQSDSDTGSDTATLTYVSASNNSGGGGGGLGASGVSALPPLVTSFQSSNQSLLDNLGKMGVTIHTLLKLPDDKNQATQEDSAVYYVGADGKRHAFPNDKVYFSWYQDFSGVQVINKDQLASIPLGMNITYKPGKKMVKFTTDPKVYVVDKGGILRHITSEQAATALYGMNWNKNIDDINDAFYTNYTFGKDVSGLSDFNPTSVEASVKYPSDSLSK